ncbi:MAG: GIY-YIG nuclease family protein [bacterium]|nr:GIY-YIG nuclease family protein [bacterium]
MFSVYVLKSCYRNYLYVGMTSNLERRFKQHNLGMERTTRAYSPFEIVLTEKFETRGQARLREKYLKSGCGKEYIKSDILKIN